MALDQVKGIAQRFLTRIYVDIFTRTKFRNLNNRVFNLTLKAKGFDNHTSNLEKSGEAAVLRRLKLLDIKVFIDVGAHRGTYIEWCLSNSNAKVVAFEPLPIPYKNLRLKYSGDRRVILYNVALGRKKTKSKITFNGDFDPTASLSNTVFKVPGVGTRHSKHLIVEVDTLDGISNELIRQRKIASIDLIKIDTEGFEGEVLEGARSVLQKYKPKAVIMEWNRHQLYSGLTLLKLSEFFFPEYQIFRIMPGERSPYPVNLTLPEEHICQYANYVFVRKEYVATFLK